MADQSLIKIITDEYERAVQYRDKWRGSDEPIASSMASYYDGRADTAHLVLELLKK